jgi:hypothetical protein
VPLVDGSGTVVVSPTSITAPGPVDLVFTFSAEDTLLTTVQIQLPADWEYDSATISGTGFAQANFVENDDNVVVDAAALLGADTGVLTLLDVTVPTASGVFIITARSATADGTLTLMQGCPRSRWSVIHCPSPTCTRTTPTACRSCWARWWWCAVW